MQLNGTEIEVQSYTSENINGELIMYNESAHKIIVANDVAISILEVICLANAECRDLTSEIIAESICKQYALSADQKDRVCHDVDYALCSFFKASLLKKIDK